MSALVVGIVTTSSMAAGLPSQHGSVGIVGLVTLMNGHIAEYIIAARR